MVNFMQSIFGFGEATEENAPEEEVQPLDAREAAYVKASEMRLKALYHLYTRYKGTEQAANIKAVHDKTESIHQYLISRNRYHELELFHIQKTENFLNTFSAIIKHHRHQEQDAASAKKRDTQGESLFRKYVRRQEQEKSRPEMVKPTDSKGNVMYNDSQAAEVPALVVPQIAINTFASIKYTKEETLDSAAGEGEIGYTSTEEEKKAFLEYVSFRLGIDPISYAGNALLSIPNSDGSQPTGLVPIIYWEGFLYALNLNDFRLFPVKMYKNR